MNGSFGSKFSLPSNIQQLYLYRSNCQALLDCILVPIESIPCQESLIPYLHLEGAPITFQQLATAPIEQLDLRYNNFIDQSKELIELCFSPNSKLSTINLSGSKIDQETFFTHLIDFLSTKKVCFEFTCEFIDKFYCYFKLPAYGRTFKFELCFEENDEYEEDGGDDDEEKDDERFDFLEKMLLIESELFTII